LRSNTRSLSLLLAWLAGAGVAGAQEAPATFEFSFSNPGARSIALGGAFVALADDATAAYANPAGLIQLLRPEVSVELRRWSFSTPYTVGGRASGTPTGFGIDTVPGLRIDTSNEDSSGLSFLSFVYPGTRWCVAVSRHQLSEFRLGTELNGLFGAGDPPDGVIRHLDQLITTRFDVVGTSLSGAFRFGEKLSLGFGLSYFEGSVRSTTAAYLMDEYPTTFYEVNSFLPHRLWVTSEFAIDDATDWGFNAGFLWNLTDHWRIGGVFRQGPELAYTLENIAGPAYDLPEGTVIDSFSGLSLELPDVFGLGIAYRTAGGDVAVSFEWDRVQYSAILDSLAAAPFVDAADVVLEDADELHLGVEYVILKSTPLVALRVGVWLDPDHRIRYLGNDPFARAIFQPGEDTLHYSVGLGWAFRSFQLDLGVDISDLVDTAAISAIYSF
jgi:long-subunit fatty acid transport protein